jgi:hypothetical protein
MTIPSTLKYDPGLVMAEGDFVILHGRFFGHGLFEGSLVHRDSTRRGRDFLVLGDEAHEKRQ